MSEGKPHYILVPSDMDCTGCALWNPDATRLEDNCKMGVKPTPCIQTKPYRYYILKESKHRPANNGGTV